MVNYRNDQNFISRRDIGVENKGLTNMETTNTTSIPFGKNMDIRGNQSQFFLTQQRFKLLLVISLIWFIVPALRKQKNKTNKQFISNFGENFNTPETILNMLSDVSPYLSIQEQENIQTIIGIFEAVNILNNIKAGTYQSPRILKNISLSANSEDKKLGIIKSIKPYLPSNNHEIIDKVIHTYNAVNKISQSLENYISKTSGDVQTQNNIDKINEILEIISPIVPYKQKQIINQIRKIIKMYTVMESSQLWEEWTQQDQKQVKSQEAPNNSNQNNNTEEYRKSDSKEQKKNIADTLKSILSPEQSQTMEVMMKMAQLLSQESGNNNEEKHKKNENDKKTN